MGVSCGTCPRRNLPECDPEGVCQDNAGRFGTPPPMRTPWGVRDYFECVETGVYHVGTPSHGGLAVSPESKHFLAASKAAAESSFSFRRDGWAWLEEDCDAPRFMREHIIGMDDDQVETWDVMNDTERREALRETVRGEG